MSRPESIENRWDILYRDYPEGYDAFSNTPYHPTVYEQLPGVIDLRRKCIPGGWARSPGPLWRCPPPQQYRDFVREGLRVAKGPVVYLGIPPGWYGGDLY